jgi:hypothetical protein
MDSPPPPPRFQFSLRTALMLTPVLAGLLHLHMPPSDHLKVAVLIDSALIACAVTMFISRKWPITNTLAFGIVLWIFTFFLSIFLIVQVAIWLFNLK